MIPYLVETSGESPALARAEAIAGAEALGGAAIATGPEFSDLVGVELPDSVDPGRLADRLALAHRVLRPLARGERIGPRLAAEGRAGGRVAVRRLGSPSGGADAEIRDAGRRLVDAGARVDLERPDRRYWLTRDVDGATWLLAESRDVDRSAVNDRRMPRLPFQRPISLPPRLARAAANLARVRPGDRVLDPFLGTGALLAEAGLLGARLYGIDLDSTMVRGALRNLAHLGVRAETLVAGDAGTVDLGAEPRAFDAIVTDPPYGRSSSTSGEPMYALAHRVVARWARSVVPGGRIVLIVPAGTPPLEDLGRLEGFVPVRVHRSLTREFRVYVRPSRRAP